MTLPSWYGRLLIQETDGEMSKTVAEVCQRLSSEQYRNFSKSEGFIARWFSFSYHLHLCSFSPAVLDLTASPPLTLFCSHPRLCTLSIPLTAVPVMLPTVSLHKLR